MTRTKRGMVYESEHRTEAARRLAAKQLTVRFWHPRTVENEERQEKRRLMRETGMSSRQFERWRKAERRKQKAEVAKRRAAR